MGDAVKIRKVTVFNVALKSDLDGSAQNPIIVRIDTDEDIYGCGEVGLAYGVGGQAAAKMVGELAKKFLISADPRRVEWIWDKVFRNTFWGQGGGPIIYGALSAIDQALWDIKGKASGLPIYELMGGLVNSQLGLYANGWYRKCNQPSDYAEAAAKVAEQGFTAMKLDPFKLDENGKYDFPRRHTTRSRHDLAYARLKAVRDAIGPDVEIMVEIHGNLGTMDAIKFGRRIEDLDPYFMEEPIDPMNVESMRKVSERVNVPIASGERLYTRYQFRPFIEQQALDILQPDIGLCGGITEAKKIAAHGEIYNLHVQPHNCGGPVSTAACVQVDAVITNFCVQEVFPFFTDGRYDILENPFETTIENGVINVRDLPGLGVSLNDDYLSRFDKAVVE